MQWSKVDYDDHHCYTWSVKEAVQVRLNVNRNYCEIEVPEAWMLTITGHEQPSQFGRSVSWHLQAGRSSWLVLKNDDRYLYTKWMTMVHLIKSNNRPEAIGSKIFLNVYWKRLFNNNINNIIYKIRRKHNEDTKFSEQRILSLRYIFFL